MTGRCEHVSGPGNDSPPDVRLHKDNAIGRDVNIILDILRSIRESKRPNVYVRACMRE